MNRSFLHSPFLFLTLLFPLITSCEAQPWLDAPEVDAREVQMLAPDPYTLTLRTEESAQGGYRLVTHVALDSGSWFVSPYSAQGYQGYFNVSLKENDSLHLGTFIEMPRSVPQRDKWQGGMSNFVEQNTSYSYDMTVNSEEDFKILGMVRFVIEPKCTLEEIPFSISHQSGELMVQKYPKLDKSTCTKVN
ncbi:MAG: hypothetical protein K9J06_14700 [Flavobacteriales bacterium]|nr:hypothetical protein [Flavobacteriales bacterium]